MCVCFESINNQADEAPGRAFAHLSRFGNVSRDSRRPIIYRRSGPSLAKRTPYSHIILTSIWLSNITCDVFNLGLIMKIW